MPVSLIIAINQRISSFICLHKDCTFLRSSVETRGAYHTTFGTAKVAGEHCAKYGKMAKLVEDVNIWELPNTDKYACEKPQ